MDPLQEYPATNKALESKPALQSKTILGIILMLLGWLSDKFHWELGDADLTAIAGNIAVIIGGVLATIGRFTAKQPLHVVKDGANVPVIVALGWIGFTLVCTVALAGSWFFNAPAPVNSGTATASGPYLRKEAK